jgi:2-aminoethylphosphonate-pyruvate transaminase
VPGKRRSIWPRSRGLWTSTRGLGRVITVHHETTTGRANDLASLGRLCRAADVPLLLDAVSSFGGEPLDLPGWNIEACAATGNKCLHGAPGIAFVLARRDVLAERRAPARSVYLDLFAHHAAQTRGIPAFTPAIPILYALQQALSELRDQGGWQARHARYVELSTLVREGLWKKGYRVCCPIAVPCRPA